MSKKKEYYFICLDERSNERTALFWRPKAQGYTLDIDEAGLYTKKQADDLNKNGRDIALTLKEIEAMEDAKIMRVAKVCLYDLKKLKGVMSK